VDPSNAALRPRQWNTRYLSLNLRVGLCVSAKSARDGIPIKHNSVAEFVCPNPDTERDYVECLPVEG
jgi:hypothetical protein